MNVHAPPDASANDLDSVDEPALPMKCVFCDGGDSLRESYLARVVGLDNEGVFRCTQCGLIRRGRLRGSRACSPEYFDRLSAHFELRRVEAECEMTRPAGAALCISDHMARQFPHGEPEEEFVSPSFDPVGNLKRHDGSHRARTHLI